MDNSGHAMHIAAAICQKSLAIIIGHMKDGCLTVSAVGVAALIPLSLESSIPRYFTEPSSFRPCGTANLRVRRTCCRLPTIDLAQVFSC